MRLFLVRHGETVDNVAGIYAGIRDSPLTAHGVLQARRLAAHFAGRSDAIGPVRHVFSSDLKRAVDTATAVVDAQRAAAAAAVAAQRDKVEGQSPPESASAALTKLDGADADADGTPPLKLVQLPELRERDFGSAEGKKFGVGVSRAAGGAESREQMRVRAERFVREHLAPLLAEHGTADGCVVVVAHGLILGSLLRVLLARSAPKEVARFETPGAVAWSNTGYVELVVKGKAGESKPVEAGVYGACSDPAEVSGDRTPGPIPASSAPPREQQLPRRPQITLSVVGVNVLKHLEGLRKTRGGIGSSQFDKRQRTMDSFFGPAAKKARIEPKPEKP